MYRTIMVSLDGSSFSEHALPLALRAARLSDAALHTDASTIDPQPEYAYLARIADRLAASWHGPI